VVVLFEESNYYKTDTVIDDVVWEP